MTKDKDNKRALKRLEQVLDAYGADPRRWPGAERAQLEKLAASRPGARHLLGEAQALERVMDMLPAAPASNELKARIVAAAVRDGGREARVVPISAGGKSAGPTARPGSVTSIWPAAALAASFAFGVYLGIAGIGNQAFEGALQVASYSTGTEADAVNWIVDGSVPLTEDLL